MFIFKIYLHNFLMFYIKKCFYIKKYLEYLSLDIFLMLIFNALRLNYMSLVHKWNDISEYWYHIISEYF